MNDPIVFVLDIDWGDPVGDNEAPPGLIGPFHSRDEAHQWAWDRVATGSWEVHPLVPHSRPTLPQPVKP